MKKKMIMAIILVLTLSGAGCSVAQERTVAEEADIQAASTSAAVSEEAPQMAATQEDLQIAYDEQSAQRIVLSDQDGVAEITSGGTYLITGSTSDGMITVDAGDDDEVTVILEDADICNTDSSAVYICSAGNVNIILQGTNRLSNEGSFGMIDGEEIDSVIYCKTDLVISGDGSLEIDSPAGHAIVGKDGLVIAGGTYDLSSGEDGINTNDSLTITSGTFNITAGDDALHTDGTLTIDSGIFTITAAEGLEGTVVTVNGGQISINASDDGINAAQKDDTLSPLIEINGGTIDVIMGAGDTDGLDSNGDIIINGGTVSISGQSACDYDGTAELTGGILIINGQQTDTIPNQFAGGEGAGPAESFEGQGSFPSGGPEGGTGGAGEGHHPFPGGGAEGEGYFG